jgi:hypothetical protein
METARSVGHIKLKVQILTMSVKLGHRRIAERDLRCSYIRGIELYFYVRASLASILETT